MHNAAMGVSPLSAYQLRFRSLFDAARGYVFPCDEAGHVDLDALSDRAAANYLFARATVGREFSFPEVESAVH